MKVPQVSIFAQTSKGVSGSTTPAPTQTTTDTHSNEFSGLLNHAADDLADSTVENMTDQNLTGQNLPQNLQGQTGGEEETLSPEELSAIAGMIAGTIPSMTTQTSLIPTNPEGPTGSLLAPAALGGIPALSYALTMGGEELNSVSTVNGPPLSETGSAPIMSPMSGALGEELAGAQLQTQSKQQLLDTNKSAAATLNALKSSVSTDSLKLAAGTSSSDTLGEAIPAQAQRFTVASMGSADEHFQRPHQALQSALDAHLSAQRSNNINNPNWGGSNRPQMPRGAMRAQSAQSNIATNTLGDAAQMASQTNQALTQAKGRWADNNQPSKASLNTAAHIADIKTGEGDGNIPDLPLAARIIQRSHYAHNMTRPNQSNKVEIDPALTIGGSDTSITENPEMAISEIYDVTVAEVAEMMTPEGIVRAPTNMQIDVDGELSVEIEAIGNEVHVKLDGTKRALDEMRGVRAEIADSLEDGEMNLGEFSTNTRDDEQRENKSSNPMGNSQGDASNDSGVANSKIANQNIVKHGSSVSAVA